VVFRGKGGRGGGGGGAHGGGFSRAAIVFQVSTTEDHEHRRPAQTALNERLQVHVGFAREPFGEKTDCGDACRVSASEPATAL